jgi:hypothetical protein
MLVAQALFARAYLREVLVLDGDLAQQTVRLRQHVLGGQAGLVVVGVLGQRVHALLQALAGQLKGLPGQLQVGRVVLVLVLLGLVGRLVGGVVFLAGLFFAIVFLIAVLALS